MKNKTSLYFSGSFYRKAKLCFFIIITIWIILFKTSLIIHSDHIKAQRQDIYVYQDAHNKKIDFKNGVIRSFSINIYEFLPDPLFFRFSLVCVIFPVCVFFSNAFKKYDLNNRIYGSCFVVSSFFMSVNEVLLFSSFFDEFIFLCPFFLMLDKDNLYKISFLLPISFFVDRGVFLMISTTLITLLFSKRFIILQKKYKAPLITIVLGEKMSKSKLGSFFIEKLGLINFSKVTNQKAGINIILALNTVFGKGVYSCIAYMAPLSVVNHQILSFIIPISCLGVVEKHVKDFR